MSGVIKRWDQVIKWGDHMQITSTMMGLSDTGKYVLATTYDQLAADNKRLEGEVARLKAEVEKLQDVPKLYEAVERACSELPGGWKIEIHCENGAGWVELYDDCGVHCDGFPTNNERLDYTVNDAIDAALSTANGEATE